MTVIAVLRVILGLREAAGRVVVEIEGSGGSLRVRGVYAPPSANPTTETSGIDFGDESDGSGVIDQRCCNPNGPK